MIHDAISNPTEVIKQRLQMYDSPYKSVFECARRVFQQEGISAFYRSYTAQLGMSLPYQAIQFSTYEYFQGMVCCCCYRALVSWFLNRISHAKLSLWFRLDSHTQPSLSVSSWIRRKSIRRACTWWLVAQPEPSLPPSQRRWTCARRWSTHKRVESARREASAMQSGKYTK